MFSLTLGLSVDDRATVEAFFTQGHLRILCATSTLAHGVNLPAHLVVIKGLTFFAGVTHQN
jgi:ATP-dependent DNA helicase HFM1/MER3